MQYRLFIHNVLQDASQIALEYFGKVSSIDKSDDNNQILTTADIAVGKYILNEIKNNYPSHNIIDEETGVVDNNSAYTWVIDPIDGTNNYANGVPQFGIMIGLLYKDVSFAGGISLPYYSRIISAEKDDGVFSNGNIISVTKEENLLKTLVAYHIDGQQENPEITRTEVKELGELVLGMRNLRISDTSYDISLVAHGNYGGYLNKTSKIWDNVAPHIIIEEAGGMYTDYYGEDMDYADALENPSQNYTCCAASPILHKQLQSIIHTK